MAVRVGIDLVSVDAVERSLHDHADRYLERVYTEQEVSDCRTADGVDPERLAARFAAKEATMKVLRPTEPGIPWRAIEVRSDPGGWPTVSLTGHAARLADEAGVEGMEVSLTHEGAYASAVVVAELRGSR